MTGDARASYSVVEHVDRIRRVSRGKDLTYAEAARVRRTIVRAGGVARIMLGALTIL